MTGRTTPEILDAYARNADELVGRYTRLDTSRLLAPVRSYLPDPPAAVLDVGAGPGRDSRWFGAAGYAVTAVEPVAAFRDAGRSVTGPETRWVDDTLPLLALLGEETFDLVYVMAVWQHLRPEDSAAALQRLSAVVRDGGRVIISLRFGPGHRDRPVFDIDHTDTLEIARHAGFGVLADFEAPSLQRESQVAGVTWRWLVLEAECRP